MGWLGTKISRYDVSNRPLLRGLARHQPGLYGVVSGRALLKRRSNHRWRDNQPFNDLHLSHVRPRDGNKFQILRGAKELLEAKLHSQFRDVFRSAST